MTPRTGAGSGQAAAAAAAAVTAAAAGNGGERNGTGLDVMGTGQDGVERRAGWGSGAAGL